MKTADFHGLHGALALHCGRDFSPDAGPQTHTIGLFFLMLASLAADAQPIQRTAHRRRPTPQHMGIDLRGGHILVAQQFLHRADIVTGFEQVRGEGMAQRVTGAGLTMPARCRAARTARCRTSSDT